MATRYPVSTITGMRQAMDRLMGEAFSPSQFGTIWPVGAHERERGLLPIDAYATDNEVVILAAVPGVSTDDIEITVERNTVTISGTVPSVAKSDHAKGATWYLHELPSGSFRRSLTLPIEVDVASTEATFESGVLRLVLPKAEASRPRQIPVRMGANGSQAETVAIDDEATPEDQS
jgi:HSP20 family molecular chaperone IbpA